MLSLKNRLKGSKNFATVHTQGRFFSVNNFSLKIKPATDGVLEIGFSVGLKFSKKAVERNRIRRQMSQIIQKKISQMKTGYFLVIIVKKSAQSLDNQNMEKELGELLKKANLIIKR